MNAATTAATGGMTLEGWCVLAMGTLFAAFLLGVWLELRRALSRVDRQEKARSYAASRLESEVMLGREILHEAAQIRVAKMRAEREERAALLAANAAREAEWTARNEREMGMESVGRILDRLAANVPVREAEFEEAGMEVARPALNMVRGGKTRVEVRIEAEGDEVEDLGNASEAVASRTGKNGAVGRRPRGSNAVKSGAIRSGAMAASR